VDPTTSSRTETCSHDDVADMIARRLLPQGTPDPRGWAFARPGHSRRLRGFASVMLAVPLVLGLIGLPANAPVTRGDELTDARAQQAQLKKEVAAQKEAVAQLRALQNGLASEISQTRAQLNGINADLTKVKTRIGRMATRITAVRTAYAALVARLATLDIRLTAISASEERKQAQLRDRREQLAERVRTAYDTNRTSLLESFLSGGTFTDLLTEMSNVVDVGEQDKALAEQITKDQETLQALHQSVLDTRAETNDLRVETAAQKVALDKSLKALKAAKAQLARLEKQVSTELGRQKAAYAAVQRNQKDAAKALAAAAAAQKRLTVTINKIIARQAQQGHIPSEYNGTLTWPMAGDVTQNFGCTGFAWEPPFGSCAHFHQGIDIVAPYGTKVRASGDGVVAYIGWNYADGADPAWIVIIAHSAGLQTWYAHLQPKYPGNISEGSHVSAGQVIGYEGNTGHSTGAHLHWAVRLNDTFVNPRLFL
jgi:murein DD-endopeptidase MepM/ murein hydrolase activator NlpD